MPAFLLIGRYFDGLTGEHLDLDLDPDFAENLGYTAYGRACNSVPKSEWQGAQDPAWIEREKLQKRLGNFIIPKKRPG